MPDRTEMMVQTENKAVRLFPREHLDIERLFKHVEATDFMMIWLLGKQAEQKDDNQKFYLKDIAETFHLPVHTITNIVRSLQEKNMVVWKHDGTGEDGTYVQITESGMQAMAEQHQQLQSTIQNVMHQFGEERFRNLLRELAAFEEISNAELEKGDTVYA